jgi:hypothetical protein
MQEKVVKVVAMEVAVVEDKGNLQVLSGRDPRAARTTKE